MKGFNYANFTEPQIKAKSIFGYDTTTSASNKIASIE